MTEGKLLMNAGRVKEKQTEMQQQVSAFLGSLYAMEEQQRRLMREWKGEAGSLFAASFQTQWERALTFGRKMRCLIDGFAGAEKKLAGCEEEIRALLGS